jgi:hypothetical protein
MVLTSKKTWEYCERWGKIITKFFRTKLGKKLEQWIELTLLHSTGALVVGARSDNTVAENKDLIASAKKIVAALEHRRVA